MTQDSTTARRLEFERRAAAAERLAAEDPARYRRRVVAFALLGYVVLWSLLFLFLALAAAGVAGTIWQTGVLLVLIKTKIAIALWVGIAVLARALWVRLDPPEGMRLDPAEFPALRDEIKRLRKAIGAPRVHEVVLTPEFNAAIVQTPRLGVFGWQKNSLILGLQLLCALSPEQCRAVIAHELAHLSGRHSRTAAWIYRVRESWNRTMIAFDQSASWATKILARFFDWYAPAFAAYSFALARRNEYEADALSAQAASPAAVGEALVRTRVLGAAIDRSYWSAFDQRSDREAEPEPAAFTGVMRFLSQSAPDAATGEDILREALRDETGYEDTHPALRDRLGALGLEATAPVAIEQSAAQAWLGDRLASLSASFDALWLETNGKTWKERYREGEQARETLAALRAKDAAALTPQERWQLAMLGERFDPERDPLAAYLDYKAQMPDDPDADFSIGRLLAARGDAACLAHLEACAGSAALARPAAELAAHFLLRKGDRDGAERWRRRAEAAFDVEYKAQLERQSLSENDRFLAPQLEGAQIQLLCERLGGVAKVERAWIASKAVEHFPEHPLHVLAFKAKGWDPNEDEIMADILKALEHGAPEMFVIRKGGKADKIAKKVIEAGTKLDLWQAQ